LKRGWGIGEKKRGRGNWKEWARMRKIREYDEEVIECGSGENSGRGRA
jgi:hypothetical protein